VRVEDSPFLAPEAFVAEAPAGPVGGELAPAWEAEGRQERWQEAAEAWLPGQATPSQVTLRVQELVELWDVSGALNERVRSLIVQALDQQSTRPAPVFAIAEAELEPELEDGYEDEDEGEHEDEVGSHLIQSMIDKGEPENAITNAVFYARNPKAVAQTLKAGSKAARQWSAIRADEVRPAARRSLGRWIVEPTLLGVFFSQYEGDPRVPAKANEQFLTRSPLLSMGRSLRDRVLTDWRLGKPPVTLDRLHELAMDIAGQAGPAMLLCHNVTKAFARGGTAITWDRVPSNPETYSDGRKVWTPAVIHRDGRITRSHSKKYKRELPSIYYVLFSDKELGTEDPGDWYHFFVAAAITAYSATGDMSPRSTPVQELEGDDDRTIIKGTKGRIQDLTDELYPIVLTERLLDLERQMTNPDLVSEPGYRGWLMANAVSFLEGGFYGESQEDVARESRRHIRGAVFGLKAAGARPGRLWVWLVPAARSLTQADLVNGFLLQYKTVEGLDASGQKFRMPKKGAK
jgi:hypothetical protein